jgi:hypothetical protein
MSSISESKHNDTLFCAECRAIFWDITWVLRGDKYPYEIQVKHHHDYRHSIEFVTVQTDSPRMAQPIPDSAQGD